MFSRKIFFGLSFLIFSQLNLLCNTIIRKQYIETEKFALELIKSKSKYLKQVTCYKTENNNNKKIIWQKKFPLPASMGFNILYFSNFDYSQNDDFLYLVNISSSSYTTHCKVTKIKGIIDNEFKNIKKAESNLFQIFDKQFKIVKNKSFLYFICNNSKESKYSSCIQYSTIINEFNTCPVITQLVYPYCPMELAFFNVGFSDKIDFEHIDFLAANFPYQIIINGKIITQKELFNYWKSFNRNLIEKSFSVNTKWIVNSIYNSICALIEQDKFRKLLRGTQITSKDVSIALDKFYKINKIKLTDLFKSKLNEKELKHKICNDKNIQFNLAVSNWIENNHMPADKIKVTNNEIKKFYNDYKWRFRKTTHEDYEFYSLSEVKKAINKEIKRLKYYRLEELLNNPPEIEIIWNKL